MSTPVPKRESVKVETSNSGRRYVPIRELIRGEMERLDRETPMPPQGDTNATPETNNNNNSERTR
jgi:hypothetical protein